MFSVPVADFEAGPRESALTGHSSSHVSLLYSWRPFEMRPRRREPEIHQLRGDGGVRASERRGPPGELWLISTLRSFCCGAGTGGQQNVREMLEKALTERRAE